MSALESEEGGSSEKRVYTVCFFDRDWTVPEINFVDADDDDQAVALASSMRPWMQRELWEHHRLIKVIPRQRSQIQPPQPIA